MGSLAIAVVFFLAAAVMDIWPADPLPYRVGQYVPQDITARVEFKRRLEENVAEEIRLAREKEPATFNINTDLLDDIVTSIANIPGSFQAAKTLDKVPPELLKQLGIKLSAPAKPSAESKTESPQEAVANAETESPQGENVNADKPAAETSEAVASDVEKASPPLTAEQLREKKIFDAWVALTTPQGSKKLDAMLKQLRERLGRCYIVQAELAEEQKIKRRANDVILMNGSVGKYEPVKDIIGLDNVDEIKNRMRWAVDGIPQIYQPYVMALVLEKLQSNPMYIYDSEKSLAAQKLAAQKAEANPSPLCFKNYSDGQVLARRTKAPRPGLFAPDNKGLNAEKEIPLLQAEHDEYLRLERVSHPWKRYTRIIANVALILMLTVMLCSYVGHYQPGVVRNNIRGLIMAAMLLLMMAITKILVQVFSLPPQVALLGVCTAGVVLTIAYDQRFAMGVSAILAAIVVFQIHAGFELMAVLITGLVLFVLQLREIRTRSRLVIVSIITAAGIFMLVWILSVRNDTPWGFALRDSLWACGAIVVTGVIVQSILPAIERIFNVATGSTLLEWCDASKPLLRHLAMESAGTYNHSLQLGTMCESAAEAIGARGLLARVGAYYHDIGKVNKPEYFSENQGEGQNKHEKLSPEMSQLIIQGHVKDGLELAREYGLPVALREFIETHHGTTLVKFFFHAAEKKSQDTATPAPEENQFRYPGPKPHSKEAAILMLADAAESSVRAMTDPTPTRIRNQVHEVVNSRLEDGQLDDCEMTLREVHIVELSLVKSLCGIYHSRVAYPEDTPKPNGNGHAAKNGHTNGHGKSADTDGGD